jgi:hypothetical protein
MGGCANQTTTGPAATQGVVIVRSYNF